MEKELTFIQKSECELTGQPSSKRVNAHRAMLLVILMVVSMCFIMIYTAVKGIDIKQNVLAFCEYCVAFVMIPLLGFAGYVHTVASNQNKEAINKGLISNLLDNKTDEVK